MFDLSLQNGPGFEIHSAPEQRCGASIWAAREAQKTGFYRYRSCRCEYGENPALPLTMTLIPLHFRRMPVFGPVGSLSRRENDDFGLISR
jgi:hypothetical protein